MAEKNVVVRSINTDGAMRCVDIFQRPDGTFGFDEYRRDAEDGRGWFAVGFHAQRIFATQADALAAARAVVRWLPSDA